MPKRKNFSSQDREDAPSSEAQELGHALARVFDVKRYQLLENDDARHAVFQDEMTEWARQNGTPYYPIDRSVYEHAERYGQAIQVSQDLIAMYLPAITQVLVEAALNGQKWAVQMAYNQIVGLPVQKVETRSESYTFERKMNDETQRIILEMEEQYVNGNQREVNAYALPTDPDNPTTDLHDAPQEEAQSEDLANRLSQLSTLFHLADEKTGHSTPG